MDNPTIPSDFQFTPPPPGYKLLLGKANWAHLPAGTLIYITPIGWVEPKEIPIHHTHDGHIAVKDEDESILDEAKRVVGVDRAKDYGGVKTSFSRIAKFWSIYLQDKHQLPIHLEPVDVAQMMTLLKVSRSVTSPKRDTFVDQAGYSHCAHTLSGQ